VSIPRRDRNLDDAPGFILLLRRGPDGFEERRDDFEERIYPIKRDAPNAQAVRGDPIKRDAPKARALSRTPFRRKG
jgi:hypothetical protein